MHDTDDDFETLAPKPSGPSLKARAIGFLSRREHSRRELARKLRAHAPDPDALEQLLDTLERENWQSDQRFAQSLVNRRAPRQGTLRIIQELRQHDVAEQHVNEIEQQLLETEANRARDVWEKKFGTRPENNKDYARQYRFMMARGFSADQVRRLLGDLPG